MIFQRFRPEVVYHLAARPDAGEDLTHMEASLQVNTMGTLSVLAASVSSGAKRVVYGGSSKVFGHHRVPSTSRSPMIQLVHMPSPRPPGGRHAN